VPGFLRAIIVNQPAQRMALLRWWALALLGVLWLASLLYFMHTTLNHDVAWYLVATDRFLDGARLYRDIIEVNPPLAFYLAVPPVAVARVTGWEPIGSLVIYVFLLIALSLAICSHLLKTQADRPAGYRVGVLFAAWAALVLQPLALLGQREHFAIILSLPYLVLLTSRFAGSRCGTGEALAVGSLAVFGFALKPYFLLVPIGLELYLVIQRRSLVTWLRPESLALGAGLCAYAVFVYLVHPEYVSVIVPFALLTYDAYEASFRSVLLKPSLTAVLFGTILYGLGRRAPSVDRRGDVFIVAMAGFLAGYLIQQKGWSYHLYPALAMVWLALASLVLQQMAVGQSRTQRAVSILTAAWAGGFILIAVMGGPYRNGVPDRMLPIVKRYAPGGAIYAFTSHVWVGFPLVNEAHVQWASRFPSQWLLPGAVRQLAGSAHLDPVRKARIEKVATYQAESVMEDFERWMPDLVVVDKQSRVDFLGYYLAQARFGALWQSYVHIGDVQVLSRGGVRTFEVWCRTGRSIPCDPIGQASPR
jgi:hypothetical protein